jgi:hypothetical protein
LTLCQTLQHDVEGLVLARARAFEQADRHGADSVAEPDVFAAEEIARVDGHDGQRDLASGAEKPHAVDDHGGQHAGVGERQDGKRQEDLVAGGGHAATSVGGLR